MTTVKLPGLNEAWKAFERTRDHADCDAVGVSLRVLCDPGVASAAQPILAGCDFGMQDRDGNLHAGTEREGGKLRYRAGVVAKRNRTTGAIRFVGPYASGPAGEEFVYMSWRQPGATAWTMRIKLLLQSLTWDEMIDADTKHRAFVYDATGRLPHANTKTVLWQAT